jgi:hypothetical protein
VLCQAPKAVNVCLKAPPQQSCCGTRLHSPWSAALPASTYRSAAPVLQPLYSRAALCCSPLNCAVAGLSCSPSIFERRGGGV